MRIVFSRNRAAQLDLLLRSLKKNSPPGETAVLYRGDTGAHLNGYSLIENELIATHAAVRLVRERDFNSDVRAALAFATSDTVTFLCDDNVLYREVETLGGDVLEADEEILTFSLRLSDPWGQPWHWHDLPRHGRGYPGSIDGHTFRVQDVLRMIEGQTIENPLMLETILARRCDAWKESRPLMAALGYQALVGVPVNTVADDQHRPHGDRYPQSALALNRRFMKGERIDLDALDFTGVDGCLHEIPFVWKQAVRA